MSDEQKFINCLLHFNCIEFVAGETNTADRSICEAFEPVLDLFLACPDWHADFEISGLQLAYSQQYFPWIADKLRTLYQRGQVDIICVHYSETIWPAFPLVDFRRSWAIDKRIMDDLGLTFSPTFFAQENFFGEGLAKVKDEFGIAHAIIPEKNYAWPYLPKDQPLDPLFPVYDMNGLDVIIQGEEHHDGRWWVFDDGSTRVKWSYDKAGDGETWIGDDPYFALGLWANPEKAQRKIEMFEAERADGTKFTTTHEFVQEMAALGIEKPAIHPIPDGPWGLQKPGVFQWMGLYFSFYELDVELRSLAFRSRAILLAGETLVEMAENQCIDVDQQLALLRRGWEKQINSEVSDASGWVPTLIEMFYGIDNALNAFFLGEKVCRMLRPKLGLTDEAIDTLRKEAVPKESLTQPEEPVDLVDEWGFELIGPKKAWKCVQLVPETYRLDTSYIHTDIDTGVKFTFNDPENLCYSPSLMDDEVISHPLATYSPDCRHLYLPLPNGLINIASDWWVIKHNDTSHVACKVDFVNHKLEFMTLMNLMAVSGRDALGVELPQNWHFTIVHGTAAEALQLATRINLFPIVIADYPVWPTKPEPWIPFTRMVTK
jgi:hypothetical protein